MREEKSLEVRGGWRRWSHYKLVNSTVVPADRAELTEYDPWDAYRANVGKYRTVEQPYSSLLELGRKLKCEEAKGVRPSELPSGRLAFDRILGPQNDADKLVLDWCNDHGLLGLVPVLSTSIIVSKDVQHDRHGGKWFTSVTEREDRRTHTTDRTTIYDDKRDLVTPPVREDSRMTWLSYSHRKYERPLLVDKRAFFGSWSPTEAFTPSRPCSLEFWEKYGEPVQELAESCIFFANAAAYFGEWDRESSVHDGFLRNSHAVLSRLAESAAPRFQLYPNRKIVVDEERIPAGLLASYALMFLWDLMEGRRALRCKNCERYFVSDEYRAAYCSRRCRNTAQSRRYRAKKRT